MFPSGSVPRAIAVGRRKTITSLIFQVDILRWFGPVTGVLFIRYRVTGLCIDLNG
jgi:hypothetical protein